VVIAGRIHPGETNSSHMLEGFINSLLDNDPASQRLLSSANFYIVPMLNPDGVASGNYRTSFSGRDLNRSFKDLDHFIYPEVKGLVNLVKRLKTQRQKVEFFFDFHSHSSKKNLFCYGPEHPEGTLHYFRSRILVKTLQKQSEMFSADQCIYKISEHKKSTARAYMLTKEKIPMTFTF
jgi:predicted deacylase